MSGKDLISSILHTLLEIFWNLIIFALHGNFFVNCVSAKIKKTSEKVNFFKINISKAFNVTIWNYALWIPTYFLYLGIRIGLGIYLNPDPNMQEIIIIFSIGICETYKLRWVVYCALETTRHGQNDPTRTKLCIFYIFLPFFWLLFEMSIQVGLGSRVHRYVLYLVAH